MKATTFFIGLLRLLILSFFIGTFLAVNPLIPFAVLVVLSCTIPMPSGTANGLVMEVWARYLIERFWKDNAFLKFAYNDSQFVLQGRIVHIPNPGAKPAVVKNRTTYPATAVRRSDNDIVYALDEYTTDPTHIPMIDAMHLSYSKQDAVLGDHMEVLDETIADDMIIKWAGNSTVVRTTGDAVGPVTGQTGNRKGFSETDLKNLMIRMNVNKVPKKDRYVMIDDNMYGYFYDSLGQTSAKDFSRYADAENGLVGKLHGFNIMTRSSVVALTSANAVKALGTALGAADNLASLAWYKNSVAFAIGDKKLFKNENDALYYGDVYSALLMAGGRVRREDGQGVYLITQDSAS